MSNRMECLPNKKALDEHLIVFAQDYIRIDTSHPVQNYSRVLSFLEKHALADGFVYQEVSLPSGRAVGVITYEGFDPSLPAIILNHHMDVVPADNNGWKTPPFAGEIRNGLLIGRGAQDMKGVAALYYSALRKLKQEGCRPKRTIHIVAVPDEELGGFTGTKQFIATPFFKNMRVGYVLDEGCPSGEQGVLLLKIAERKVLQIQVVSEGEATHGSQLICCNPVHELLCFLQRIVKVHDEQKKRVGVQQAGELLSCNITSLAAGVQGTDGHIALNMVPALAQATVDIRVPPTKTKKDVMAMLDELIKPFSGVRYTILVETEEELLLDDHRTELYKALDTIIEAEGLQVRPHFFEASSDVRFYKALGIQTLGLTPFTCKANLHGTNESVPVQELVQGRDLVASFLRLFCE